MDIDFMLVPGLDDSNSIRFTTRSQREAFYEAKIVGTIENAFFPPKYTDVLKVSCTDVTFVKNVNYLRFAFGDINNVPFYYYYFIDYAEYINEDIIQLRIRLDTITTYMFNIKICEGIIERKHINRYVNGEINRDYIRENYSQGVFIEDKKQYIIKKNALKWGVCKITKSLIVAGSDQNRAGLLESANLPTYPLPFAILVGPIDNNDITIRYRDNDRVMHYPYVDIMAGLKDNRLVEMYYVPFCPVKDMTYDEYNRILEVPWNQADSEETVAPLIGPVTNWVLNTGYVSQEQKVYTHSITVSPSTTLTGTMIALPVAQNTLSAVAYSSKYIPSLMDENYIRIVAGSNTANTTYPLYRYTELGLGHLDFKYSCNLEDGTLTYSLYDGNLVSPDEDKYSNIIIDADVPKVSLANDPWQNYLANIQGRLFTVGLDTITAGLEMFISPVKGVGSIMTPAQKAIDDAFVVSYKPPVPKQLGNTVSRASSWEFAIWYQWYFVQDYEYVAWQYHKYGNKVMLGVHGINAWYTYFNNRHYFNYVKFQTIDIDLTVLTEQEVVNNIKQRFINGITLWNVPYNGSEITEIGDGYAYDNVENSSL